MKKILFLLFFFLFVLEVSGIDISTCQNITSPGNYYLTADILNTSSTCFTINTSNILFDCQEHLIDGTGGSNTIGIYVDAYDYGSITNITIKNCTIKEFYTGLHFYGSSSNIIDNSKISLITLLNLTNTGIYMERSKSTNLSNVNINQSGYGIYLYYSDNNKILNCSINNSNYGIYTSVSDNNTFENSYFYYNTWGVYIYDSSHNKISFINTHNNSINGIYLTSGSNYNIINNSISNYNQIGYKFRASGNEIYNSIGNSNEYYGMYIDGSYQNVVENNTFQENKGYDFNFYGGSDFYCNNIVKNNIGSGNRPIEYYNYSINLENKTFSELILCDADYSNLTNIIIKGSNILYNNGLIRFHTSNTIITKLNSTKNAVGIYIFIQAIIKYIIIISMIMTIFFYGLV